jgi:hypothetical protein
MPTPNYDLGLLITLNVFLTIIGMLGTTAGLTMMGVYLGRQLREIQTTGERVAIICERIDARLRRDFPDIGGDLGDEGNR